MFCSVKITFEKWHAPKFLTENRAFILNLVILLTECGLLPLRAIVYGRQLKFFRRFKDTIITTSSRGKLFSKLVEKPPPYLQHFIDLDSRYSNCHEIYLDYNRKMKDKIIRMAANDSHYKYMLYMQINPTLKPSVFVDDMRFISRYIIKFRLGCHNLPIETGRWCRKLRCERLCETCDVLGDEVHFLFHCTELNRDGLNIPNNIKDLWDSEDVFELFERILAHGKCLVV